LYYINQRKEKNASENTLKIPRKCKYNCVCLLPNIFILYKFINLISGAILGKNPSATGAILGKNFTQSR